MVDRVHDAAGGQPPPRPGADGARAQGRVPQALLRPAAAGLRAGAGQRAAPRAGRGDRAGQDQEAHHRGGGGPPRRPRHPGQRGSPTRSRPRSGWPTGWCRSRSSDGPAILFSERLACATCGISFPEVSPRMFSFNNPYGACPDCGGIGTRYEIDPERVVPDRQALARPGRARAVGRDSRGTRVQADPPGARAAARLRPRHAVGASSRRRCATSSCTARPTTASRAC